MVRSGKNVSIFFVDSIIKVVFSEDDGMKVANGMN